MGKYRYREEDVYTLDLVKVVPVEFDLKKDAIVRYYNIFINPNLTQEKFDEIIQKVKTKKKVSISENPESFIFYQYPKEPLIIIDRLNHRFLTTRGVWNYYSHEKIKHQATIILRILKKYKLAGFKRKRINIELERLGMSKEERKETYQEIERAIKRKLERKLERIKERLKEKKEEV